MATIVIEKPSPALTEPRNREALDRLVQRVRASPGIVPFVGAGLSIRFGFPGWRAFLEQMVAQSRPNDHKLAAVVRSHLNRGRFEEAAEHIIRVLGRGPFDRAVVDTFSDDAVQAPEKPTALHLLPRIAHGPVVTTNFDHMLESVFRDDGQAFDLVLWGAKVQTASDVLAEDLRLLLKLHGDALDSEDRILTRQEYRQRYGSADPEQIDSGKPLPQLLERLFRTRSVLFLGCSLQGDRYMRLLRRIGDDPSVPEHFAVVEAPSSAEALRLRERFLRAHHLTAIWIPEHRWDTLVPLVASLGDAAAQAPRRRRSARIPLSFQVSPRRSAQDVRKRTSARAERARFRQRWDRLQSDQAKVRFLRRHGEALYQAGFYQDYIELASEAAAAAERLGQVCDQAEFFYNLHLTWRAKGGSRNQAKADACLRKAERLLRACPSTNLDGKVMHDKAHLLAERGSWHEAAAAYRTAARFLRRAGDHRLGTTWIGLGRVLGKLGDRQARVRYARRAIAYSAQHGEAEEEARAWLALATAHADNGQARLARKAQERAVALLQTKGDQRTLARALNDLGAAYYQDGDIHRALEYFLRALWWDQQIHDRSGLASGLSNVAWLHWEAAEGQEPRTEEGARIASLNRSSEYFSQALAVQRALGDKLEVAQLLAYRSMVLAGLDDERAALQDIHSALPILRARRDWTSLAVAFNNRGTIQERLNRDSAALRSYRTALRHADRGLEFAIRQTARRNMIPLLRRLGRDTEADRVARELRSLERRHGRSDMLARPT